jgi:hypothetical protein
MNTVYGMQLGYSGLTRSLKSYLPVAGLCTYGLLRMYLHT